MHTITRENTGPNIGYRLPIVHWEFIHDWDGLDVKCVPKGSGSENMSFLKMCVPADGVKGIKQFVLESIVGAGGKPCPPGIVGVGIGGSADYAMYLAKEAIARPVGTRNPDPIVAQLEDELFGLLNETGIGPMGLGGDVTVLQCHIEHADTHMTLNPVAVNYQCWAARRASRAHRRRRRPSSSTGRPDDDGRHARGHVPDHRSAGDPQAPRRRRGAPSQGHIIGIRDRTQIRIFDQGVEPPMDLTRRVPAAHGARRAQARRGQVREVCIGTTTSARMVRFTEPLGEQYGVRAICGKGGFPDEAIEPMRGTGWSTSRSSAAPPRSRRRRSRRSRRSPGRS